MAVTHMLICDGQQFVELVAGANESRFGIAGLLACGDFGERAEPALMLAADDIHEMPLEAVVGVATVPAVYPDGLRLQFRSRLGVCVVLLVGGFATVFC